MRTALLLTLSMTSAGWAQDAPTYWKDVRPLLRKHCTVCHSAKNVKEADISGGLALDSLEGIKKGVDGVPVIRTGMPDDSLLTKLLVSTNPKRRMPLDAPPLSKETIDVFRTWIAKGAKEGIAPAVDDDTPTVKSSKTRKLDVVLPTATKAKLDLSIKIGPLSPVTAVAFSPTQRLLAAGSYGQVVLWDLDKVEPVKILTNVLGAVNDLKFSADGKILAVAGGQPSAKGDLRLYTTGDWKLSAVLRGHDDTVMTVAFSPKGDQLASASFDHTVKLWNLEKQTLVKTFSNHSDFVYGVAFAPSGKHLYSASKDRTVQMVDIATGKSAFTFSGVNEDIMTVAAHPDGKSVISSGFESALYWWNPLTGEKLKTSAGHSVATHEVAFSRDGERIVSAGADRTIKVFDSAGVLVKAFAVGSIAYSCALDDKKQFAASGSFDGLTRVWHVPSGRLLLTLVAQAGEKDPAQWLALTPQSYAVGSDAWVKEGVWLKAGKSAGNIWPTVRNAKLVAQVSRGEDVAEPVAEKK